MQAADADSFDQLLERAKQGDRAAWEQLFDLAAEEKALGGEILAIARKILPRGDRARDFVETRDVFQSALRSGWLRAEHFRGTTKQEFMNWLLAIFRRKIGRAVRRKRPQAMGEIPEHEARGRDDTPGVLTNLIREEVKTRVRAAISELPEDQRVVIGMRLDGLKAPEIADRLGITPEAVRKRESRAVKKLLEAIRE